MPRIFVRDSTIPSLSQYSWLGLKEASATSDSSQQLLPTPDRSGFPETGPPGIPLSENLVFQELAQKRFLFST